MTVKVGVYDFFAYTIPGFIYLSGIIYGMSMFGVFQLNIQVLDIPLSIIIATIILAYVSGLVFEPLAILWHRLFMKENFPQKIFTEFQSLYPNKKLKFDLKDFPILLAKIRIENFDLAGEIEKFNATNITLRNISFGILVFSILFSIQYFQSYNVFHLVLGVLLFITAIISIRRSMRFVRMYYFITFEISVALQNQKNSKQKIAKTTSKE